MTYNKKTALELLELSAQAYILANTGRCVLPEGFSSPQPIRLSVQGRPALLEGDNLDIWGYVTEKDKTTYIIFRGTQILKGIHFAEEWVLDACSFPLMQFGEDKDALVHFGFHSAYMALRNAIISALPLQSYKMVITGHSLGAALATLCQQDFGGDLLTFACPRVGNQAFARQLWKGPTYRIINSEDIVTKVPTDPPFRHGGNEVSVPVSGCLSWSDAHSLDTYRAGIIASNSI